MKISKLLIIIALLTLVGCASQQYTSNVDAFKGQSAQKIYNGGMQAIKKKNWDTATKHFEALDAMYPFGKYAEMGQKQLIFAYYKNSDTTSATAAADRYIHLYPRGQAVDYAYYIKGIAFYEQNTTWLSKYYHRDPAKHDLAPLRASFLAFSDLIQNYPKSKYAPKARRYMVRIRNMIAQHELNIAQFYYDRKAYVAAANRARYIVSHIEGAPQVKPALLLMYKAYRALGADHEAQDTLKIIKTNYPNMRL